MSAAQGLSAEAVVAERTESRRRISTRRRILVTLGVATLTFLFFAPLFNLAATSVKDPDQVYAAGARCIRRGRSRLRLTGRIARSCACHKQTGRLWRWCW